MPTAKPATGALTDQDHPLAPDYLAFLLNAAAAGDAELDSVGGTLSIAANGIGHALGVNAYGDVCRDYVGTADHYPKDTPAPPPTDFTLVARIFQRSQSSFQTLFGSATIGLFIAGSTIRFYSNSATASGTIALNTWTTVGFTRDTGGNAYRYFKDGVQVGSDFAGTGVGFSIFSNGIAGHGGERFDGLYDYLYIWGRVLSAADHAAIHADPFMVFTPISAPLDWMGGTAAAGSVPSYRAIPSGLTPPNRT